MGEVWDDAGVVSWLGWPPGALTGTRLCPTAGNRCRISTNTARDLKNIGYAADCGHSCGVDVGAVNAVSPAMRALRRPFVGRFTESIDLLIDAVTRLSSIIGVRCTIIGDGPERGMFFQKFDGA